MLFEKKCEGERKNCQNNFSLKNIWHWLSALRKWKSGKGIRKRKKKGATLCAWGVEIEILKYVTLHPTNFGKRYKFPDNMHILRVRRCTSTTTTTTTKVGIYRWGVGKWFWLFSKGENPTVLKEHYLPQTIKQRNKKKREPTLEKPSWNRLSGFLRLLWALYFNLRLWILSFSWQKRKKNFIFCYNFQCDSFRCINENNVWFLIFFFF